MSPDTVKIVQPSRIAVRLTPDALRHVRKGHPWIFDESIVSLSKDGAPGDLAVIFDDKRRFVALGLFDPASAIRIKVLHAGEPVQVDGEWFQQRVAAAIARRSELAADRDTNAYRLVHGENDGLPGVIVDQYADTCVLKLYSEAWLPHLTSLVDAVRREVQPATLILRTSRSIGARNGEVLVGKLPSPIVRYRENGLAFEADVVSGQKTGMFLDQRENRRRLRGFCDGVEVLDVFSCAGGFALNAAKGGASAIHTIDSSPHTAVAVARHLEMNSLSTTLRSTTGDAFETMADLVRKGRRYGVVVIDPPSFAQRQINVRGALDAYRRLTSLGMSLLTDDGLLVQASCSSRVSADDFFAAIREVSDRRHEPLREVVRTFHPVDHPIGFSEGAYLKALFARRV